LHCYGDIGKETQESQFFIGFITNFLPKGIIKPACWGAIRDQTRSIDDLANEMVRVVDCTSLNAPPLPGTSTGGEICPKPGSVLFKPVSVALCVWTEVKDMLALFLNNIDDLLTQCVDGKEQSLIEAAVADVALGEEELAAVIIKVFLKEKDIAKDVVRMSLAHQRGNMCELGGAAADLVQDVMP
jgi:hypothetical protein